MSKKVTNKQKEKKKMILLFVIVTIGALLFGTLYVMKEQTRLEQQAYYNTAR